MAARSSYLGETGVRGHDALLPPSHLRILGPRPRGLWSLFSARARGGGFEEAKIEDGPEADVRLAAVAGQAVGGRQRHGGPGVPDSKTHIVTSTELIGSR